MRRLFSSDDRGIGIDLATLEDLRLRLRELVPFLDKKKRGVVYTDFQDEVLAVREEHGLDFPKMTGVQYEKKVKDYLRNHADDVVIQRLRTNQPLNPGDLQALEQTLVEIGEADGPQLLLSLIQRSGAASLGHFVRSLVGLDRAAAQAAFSRYLNDRSLSIAQMRFIEMLIDQLTARGVMEASALYEPPFSDLHAGGPDELFSGRNHVVDGLFDALRDLHSGLATTAA